MPFYRRFNGSKKIPKEVSFSTIRGIFYDPNDLYLQMRTEMARAIPSLKNVNRRNYIIKAERVRKNYSRGFVKYSNNKY